MSDSKENSTNDELKAFEENPYNPENKRPEDIIRLFYIHNVPIIPVISKRGMLLGIIRKDDAISELSDIERVTKLKIDKFVSKLARKMSFDDLLNYGKIRDFLVINLFGEVQGRWSRLQLFSACESNNNKETAHDKEIAQQREEQVLEWMIYLILEHIPRALYALNEHSKTIFYNSLFEDLYNKKFNGDVDTALVEKSLNNSDKNEIFSGKNDSDLYFFNSELDIFYEKIPMTSNNKTVGYLIYCDDSKKKSSGLAFPGIDARGTSLNDMLISVERQIIVDTLKENGNLNEAAQSLKIGKKTLAGKIKKYNIKTPKK